MNAQIVGTFDHFPIKFMTTNIKFLLSIGQSHVTRVHFIKFDIEGLFWNDDLENPFPNILI